VAANQHSYSWLLFLIKQYFLQVFVIIIQKLPSQLIYLGARVVVMSSEILVTTGPEALGKTTLASQLSDYCKNPLVPYFAKNCL
jgi:hypothetical protein